jgi:hypothetical protein
MIQKERREGVYIYSTIHFALTNAATFLRTPHGNISVNCRAAALQFARTEGVIPAPERNAWHDLQLLDN